LEWLLAPTPKNVLFQLAEADPKLYGNHAWRDAVYTPRHDNIRPEICRLSSERVHSRARKRTAGTWLANLVVLIGEYSELRTYVYQLLKDDATPGIAMLAKSSCRSSPMRTVLLAARQIEIEHKHPFDSWSSIERVVTEHRPSEEMEKTHTRSFPFLPSNSGGNCSP